MSDEEAPPTSRFRRNAPWIAVVLVAFLVGPSISRYLGGYRGVILEQNDEETYLGFSDRPPRWVSRVDAELGAIVKKDQFSWSSEVVPAETTDRQIVRMEQRYNDTYEGIVIDITPPMTPTGPHVALLHLDGSGKRTGKLNVPLHGEHLAALRIGDRLRKDAGAWEPVIIAVATDTPEPEAPAAPDGAPTPGPSGAPAAPAPSGAAAPAPPPAPNPSPSPTPAPSPSPSPGGSPP